MNTPELFSTEMTPFQLEQSFISQGYAFVAGVDEAGRGALAGPVVAAAAIFQSCPEELKGKIKDSKKLSPETREKLFSEIHQHALAVGVGIVERDVIDEINILQAALKAMAQAVSQLDPQPNICLIDGNQKVPIEIDQKLIIKGDDRVFSIGAASIIAKVVRDRLMVEMDRTFPNYGFAVHKGYGTETHRKAIENFGPCPEHRTSFTLPAKRP